MERGAQRPAIALLRGEGPRVDLPGQVLVRKAGGLTTGGPWLLEEVTIAPYCQSAMPGAAEIARVFYIVDGMLVFTIGAESITVTRGATVVVPMGMAHAAFNPTAAPAIYLVVGVDGTLA